MHDIAVKISYATVTLFWPVFLLTCVFIAAWVIHSQQNWTNGRRFVLADIGTAFVLAVALPLVVIVLWGADFAYWDNEMFLENTVSGKSFSLAIWPHVGRYFPLGIQEFNAIALIGTTPIIYYSFVALELLAFCLILNILMEDLGVGWRVLATTLILWVSGTAVVFIEAVMYDKNIIFALAVFLLAMKRFDHGPSRLNMLIALLAAQVAIYLKEPVFLLIGTIALVRLFHFSGSWNRNVAAWISRRPLELGLLAVCCVFVGQFAASLVGFFSTGYIDDGNIGPVQAFLRYLRMDPALLVFGVGIGIRLVLRGRAPQLDPFWDAVGVGGVLYFCAVVATGLSADRYMAPVNLVGVLFAIRQAEALVSWRPAFRFGVVGAAAVMGALAVMSGSLRVAEHHSVVFGTAKLADFVAAHAEGSGGPVRLFFPDTEGFRIMNFASYMRYRHGDILAEVEFTSPREFPDGLCVWYQPYRCEHAKEPKPGDIVVQLGDDSKRTTNESSGKIVLQDSLMPKWLLSPLGRLFYVQAPLYDGTPMPEGWLETTVVVEPKVAELAH
jgi:hypothetical protein